MPARIPHGAENSTHRSSRRAVSGAVGALLTAIVTAAHAQVPPPLPVPALALPQPVDGPSAGFRVELLGEIAMRSPLIAGAGLRVEGSVYRIAYDDWLTVAGSARWTYADLTQPGQHRAVASVDLGVRIGIARLVYLQPRGGFGLGAVIFVNQPAAFAAEARFGLHGYFGRWVRLNAGFDFVLSTAGDNGVYFVGGLTFG